MISGNIIQENAETNVVFGVDIIDSTEDGFKGTKSLGHPVSKTKDVHNTGKGPAFPFPLLNDRG